MGQTSLASRSARLRHHAIHRYALTVVTATALIAAAESAHAADKPPAPPAKPGERTHDGLYIRAGASAGRTWLDYDAPMTTGVPHEGSAFGGGLTLEFAAGWTLPFGLVLGADTFLRSLGELDFENYDVTRGWDESSTALNEIGAFARYYPFPRYGLHAEATVGVVKHTTRNEREELQSIPVACVIVFVACFAAEYETVTAVETSWGYGLGLGVGYDLWIGRQWSFGFTGRMHVAHTWRDGRSYWFLTPTVGIGFTYH